MSKYKYYNETNTCNHINEDGKKCENKLVPGKTYREYDIYGKWTGKYICPSHRYEVFKNYQKETKKVYYCEICGKELKHIYGKYFDKKLCKNCNERYDPNSCTNIRKQMSQCRKIIDIDNFENLSTQQLGRIGEEIVCITVNAINRNVYDNNFRSETDTLKHDKYGIIQIRCTTLNSEKKWNFEVGGIYDNLIILCMDEFLPWNNVERVYIIPSNTIEIYGKMRIGISRNSPSRFYEKNRVDEKPYNDTWQNIKKKRYLKSIG